jgi:dynein heavy chain
MSDPPPIMTTLGKPPRIIEIQRKKRLYSSIDITTLLLEKGIDYLAPSDPDNKPWCELPLEAFDNVEYDVYPDPASWMDLGINEDGVQTGLPAKVLYRSEEGYPFMCQWMDARVTSFNPTLQKFNIEYAANLQKDTVSRINVLFNCEDPFRFADRIYAAYTAREIAYSVLRYHLYIDSMVSQSHLHNPPVLHSKVVLFLLTFSSIICNIACRRPANVRQ